MNPLDTGKPFAMSLMSPNPTAGRNKAGCWYRVSFELSEDEWVQFQNAKDLAGLVIEVDQCRAIVANNLEPDADDAVVEPTENYGQQAKKLALSEFFHTKQVFTTVCTDKQYHSWVKTQKCTVCGSPPPNEAHHIRNLIDGLTGWGRKDEYTQLAHCKECHDLYHLDRDKYLAAVKKHTGFVSNPKNWLAQALGQSHWKACREILRDTLGYESWRDIPPSTLHEWAGKAGVAHFIPAEYK